MNISNPGVLIGLALVVLVLLGIGPIGWVLLAGGAGGAGYVWWTKRTWDRRSEADVKALVAQRPMLSLSEQVKGLLTGETRARLLLAREQQSELHDLKGRHGSLVAKHNQLQQQHHALRQEKKELDQSHRRLQQEQHGLRRLHSDTVNTLQRARRALLPSEEERICAVFCAWCQTAGGHIRKVDRFRDTLHDEFPDVDVRLIYRDGNRHDLIFNEEATGGPSYWLVTTSDDLLLFPRPRTPQIFRELEPVYGGRLSPQHVTHVVPALVEQTVDGFVLRRPGLVSATAPPERYVPPESVEDAAPVRVNGGTG